MTVSSALYRRPNHGLHRSSIHSDKDDIMPVRTRVASDAKQRRERAGEGGDATDQMTCLWSLESLLSPSQGGEI